MVFDQANKTHLSNTGFSIGIRELALARLRVAQNIVFGFGRIRSDRLPCEVPGQARRKEHQDEPQRTHLPESSARSPGEREARKKGIGRLRSCEGALKYKAVGKRGEEKIASPRPWKVA